MEPIRFAGEIRYWSPGRSSGLAVVDVPQPFVAVLGGLKQARVRGRMGAAPFTSSVMPAGGGRLALSVSKAMMSAAGAAVGETVGIEISGTGRGEDTS